MTYISQYRLSPRPPKKAAYYHKRQPNPLFMRSAFCNPANDFCLDKLWLSYFGWNFIYFHVLVGSGNIIYGAIKFIRRLFCDLLFVCCFPWILHLILKQSGFCLISNRTKSDKNNRDTFNWPCKWNPLINHVHA